MYETYALDWYWDEDDILDCVNGDCDWTGTVDELDNPAEDVYRCPKCGGSTAMILSREREEQTSSPV